MHRKIPHFCWFKGMNSKTSRNQEQGRQRHYRETIGLFLQEKALISNLLHSLGIDRLKVEGLETFYQVFRLM